MEGMIEVTGIDLVKCAQEVYALSSPQGMGFLHYQEGGLSEDDAKAVVDRCAAHISCALDMDYVKGRACKFHIRRQDGKLFTNKRWYDHTDSDLNELLSRLGIKND
jgi:hypothetical protein